MNNPPSKEELIISIINYIEKDVISELKGQKRFHAHVAKNSLSIILRQLRLEEENNSREKERLAKILKIDGDLIELNRILCEKINNDQINIKDNIIYCVCIILIIKYR